MNFKAGTATLVGEEQQGPDVMRARVLLEKSGFSVPRTEVTARGEVVEWKDRLALRVPGQQELFILEGGKQWRDFKATAKPGDRIRVTGNLHPAHADAPPGLTVEEFKML